MFWTIVDNDGWHIPSDIEWSILTDYLGGADRAGDLMKTAYGWEAEGNGTNASGFSGLPEGYKSSFAGGNVNYAGYWWTSTLNGTGMLYRSLVANSASINAGAFGKGNGFSIRCIRDSCPLCRLHLHLATQIQWRPGLRTF